MKTDNQRTKLLYLVFQHICTQLENKLEDIPDLDDETVMGNTIDYLLESGDSDFVKITRDILELIDNFSNET